MVFAPGGDFVEIVARGEGGAGQQQQDLGQRVDDPPRLTVIIEPGKMLQQQSYGSLGQVLVGQTVACPASPSNSGVPRITSPRQAKIVANLTSVPCLNMS